jgi:hypothetical protein
LKQGYLLSSIFLIEKSLSNEKAYSYDGYSINLDLSVPILKKWGADFFINYSGRNYQDKDPIFGIVREDTKKSFGLSVSNKMLRFYDLIPEVGLMYEKNDSTLDYFEYDKLSIIFKISQ